MLLTAAVLAAQYLTAGAAPAPTALYLANKHHASDQNATTLLAAALDAIGDARTVQNITTFAFRTDGIYRTQTLTQNYNLGNSDQSVAEAGAQNLSFSITDGHFRERVDRYYKYNDYWIWAHPDLRPDISYTVVVQDGDDGYACFTNGSNNFYTDDPQQSLGYADAYLTDYLIQQARQYALPWLLSRFVADVNQLVVTEIVDPTTNMSFPTLEHKELGLSLCVDGTSNLPYLIRSHEEHAIFGPSTTDLLLSNYSTVAIKGSIGTLLLPHRMQTVYNSLNTIEDFVIDHIDLNPVFPSDYFEPLTASESQNPPTAPSSDPEYPRSEVHAFFETGLWNGPLDPSTFNVGSVVADQPDSDLPQVQSVYVGYPDYVQLVVEFENGVLVTDAPAHRSKIVIDWVNQTMNKSVTHIVPSHHHHDHASGIGDYVAQGATLVVPEVAREYYRHINNGSVIFATYNEEKPYVLKDQNIQFTALWRDENPHARDWSYGVVTKVCPSATDSAVAFIADVISPGSESGDLTEEGRRWDVGYARQWLNAAVQDGLPKSSALVCSHGGNGTTTSLQHVLDVTGFAYPDLTVQDWKAGGLLCG